MIQDFVEVNKVRLPIVKEGDEIYYPISYIGEKVLLKVLQVAQLRQNGYGEYLKQFKIDYGEDTGGIQSTYCISETGLQKTLKNSRIGGLSREQKIAMNGLLQYLNMDLISIDERFVNSVPDGVLENYDEYIRDCINEVLKDNPKIMWQKCTKCDCYYPYHLNFFKVNLNGGKNYDLYTVCRSCCKWDENRSKDWIRRNDSKLSTAYRDYGFVYYKMCRDHDVIGIYNFYIDNQIHNFPTFIDNLDDVCMITKHCIDSGKFDNIENLSKRTFFSILNMGYQKYDILDIFKNIFGEDYKEKLYKYHIFNALSEYNKTSVLKDMTLETAITLMKNYIKDNNIVIDDVYSYDYEDLLQKSKAHYYAKTDILGFIMKFYEDQYIPYKFNIVGQKYWQVKEHADLAMRCLIEKDLKLPIHKIPLYITKYSIRKHSFTLYNILYDKRFYKSLYEWINELYPDQFNEQDFNVHLIRYEFDSLEENQIDTLLREELKNVIYNTRGSDTQSITINGMQPDWFVFTSDRVWIIEYFGMYQVKGYNTRVNNYIEKTEDKIFRYDEMKYYEKIYLFPEDLKNGFKGLREKIEIIKYYQSK